MELQSPDAVGACDSFVIDAAISGTGSRNVSYLWGIRPAAVPYENGQVAYNTAERLAMKSYINETLLKPVLKAAKISVEILPDYLQSQQSYVFFLLVTNFFSEQSVMAEAKVKISSAPIPQVYIAGHPSLITI